MQTIETCFLQLPCTVHSDEPFQTPIVSAKASTIESLISIVQESRLGESIVSRSDSSLNVSRASPAQSDSSLTDIINYINADLFTSCAADKTP